jgi:hypothetical protein
MNTMREYIKTIENLNESIHTTKIFQIICDLDLALEKVNFETIPNDQKHFWKNIKENLNKIIESNPQ